MGKGFADVVKEGKMTAHLHETDDGSWVVADQAGWLPGSFSTREAALESARQANGL